MNPHTANWDEVRRLLRESRNLLEPENGLHCPSSVPVGSLTGTLDEFEEFLDHNELELAWDALAEVAVSRNATPACWHGLSRAAALMQLPEKERLASYYTEPAVSCDRALAIAHADAKSAYRDLSTYRIQMVLESDGWHIDYELKNSEIVAGGGPHYVINTVTGVIISKRYEQ